MSVKTCVDRSFTQAPSLSLDRLGSIKGNPANNKDPHFKEAMKKVSEASGVKGTKYERKFKDKYL